MSTVIFPQNTSVRHISKVGLGLRIITLISIILIIIC